MLKEEHTDEFFRNRLYDTEVTPPVFVWENVEAELKKRKKKRFFMWFWGGGTAVVGLSLVGYLWWNQNNHTMVETAAVTAAHDRNSTRLETTSYNAPASEPAKAPTNLIATTPTTAQAALQGTAASTQSPLREHIGFRTYHNREKRTTAAEEEKFAQTNLSLKDGGTLPDNLQAPILAAPQSDGKEGLTQNTAKEQITRPTDLNLLAAPIRLLSRPDRPINGIKPIRPFWRKKNNNKNCYDFTNYRPIWFLDGYIAPMYAARRLAADNADEQTWKNARNQHENTSFAFNGGLRGTLVQGAFLFRAGVQYSQFTEVLRHTDPNAIRTLIIRDSNLVNGEWQVTEQQTTQYGTLSHKRFNRYAFIDIPLAVGYEYRHKRFGASLNAGISANVWFGKKGSILTVNQKPEYLTAANNIFKATVGLSSQASIQAFYHINARTRVFAEPTYQGILKPVTLSVYPLEQKYQLYSLKLGITQIME